MRSPVLLVAMVTLVSAHPLRAQEPRQDSATVRRAHRPLLRWGEVIGVAAATGLALATDQTLRDRLNDPTTRWAEPSPTLATGWATR